jgi:hypothetical protein
VTTLVGEMTIAAERTQDACNECGWNRDVQSAIEEASGIFAPRRLAPRIRARVSMTKRM